jgi:hypothetical protein
MAKSATVKVYEVLFDGAGDGPACDGTFTQRFRSQADANAFATGRTCYGNPCRVPVPASDIPRRIAARWGMA